MLRRDEEVTVGPGPESDHVWFTDGYGDYIRHFVSAMMTFPEWARRDSTPGRSADRRCVSLWPASATPSTFSTSGGAVELGVKFHSDVAGYILGIRFFKNSSDTGTDTGQLWTESGTLLGQVVFTGETGSGWQQMNFSSPIPISANTGYIAAYHTTSGFFSYDLNYFTSAGVDNVPLHAPANGVDPNGVFVYSSTPAFPQSTYSATNYWVDVVFSQSSTLSAPTELRAGGSTPVRFAFLLRLLTASCDGPVDLRAPTLAY